MKLTFSVVVQFFCLGVVPSLALDGGKKEDGIWG